MAAFCTLQAAAGAAGNVRLFNGALRCDYQQSVGQSGAGLAISPDGAWVYAGRHGKRWQRNRTLVKMDSQSRAIRTSCNARD